MKLNEIINDSKKKGLRMIALSLNGKNAHGEIVRSAWFRKKNHIYMSHSYDKNVNEGWGSPIYVGDKFNE